MGLAIAAVLMSTAVIGGEEKIFRCTVDTLHKTVTENGLTKTSLIIVGNCMGDRYLRSMLYHPTFTTEYREATE